MIASTVSFSSGLQRISPRDKLTGNCELREGVFLAWSNMIQIQELKKDLAEIKRDYAVLFGDVFWRYEYKSVNSYSFTHNYCRICNEVRPRYDKETINCFLNHWPLINLERYVSEFYSVNIDTG